MKAHHEKRIRFEDRHRRRSANEGGSARFAKGEAQRANERTEPASGQAASCWAALGTLHAIAFYAAYGEYLPKRAPSPAAALQQREWEQHQRARHGGLEPRQQRA